MTGNVPLIVAKEQLLSSLMEFYPLKVEETVLITAVQQNNKAMSTKLISETIGLLRDEGEIEESLVKTPFGDAKTNRYKISPSGIEHLRSLRDRRMKDRPDTLSELECQMRRANEQVLSDMATLRENMETGLKGLGEAFEGMKGRIADLSQELIEVKGNMGRVMGRFEEERAREDSLILRILSGDERTIFEAILDDGGAMLQKDLVARTRMSNAKVSRTVDRLEGRGVLTKERRGATNRLKLTVRPPPSTGRY